MRFWCFLFLLPSVALAKTETWPRLYNNGVTAYHSNDFAHAAQLFESATASPDRTLQQRALYNLGNTSYRLGEAQKPQAQQLWQRAIKNYESALALDPHDTDAKFNHDFVKKKLEELKKQQQQQQNQQNQQDKKQDQKKDDQQQKEQQQQKQDSQGQPQKPENKQSEQQQQQQQESQEQQKAEQKQKDEQQKQQGEQQKESPTEQQPQPQSGQPENEEKRQAAALLDHLREDERNWNFFPEVQMKDLKDSGEPAKDW